MFFLIRHGESEENAGLSTSHPHCGRLTPRGYKQADCITEYLKFYPLDLIVTSPYLRAKQTAEPTAFVFYNTPECAITEEEWEVQEFTYLSSRRWTHSTAKDRRPEVDSYWKNTNPDYVDGPGSESFREFIGRVHAFLERLKNVEEEHETIAVFSHEQFIAAVLWCIERRPTQITSETMRDFRHFFNQNRLPNGGIVELNVRRSHDEWRYELITLHLKEAVPGPEPHALRNWSWPAHANLI